MNEASGLNIGPVFCCTKTTNGKIPMKKLSAKQEAAKAAHIEKLRELQGKVEDEINEFNSKLGDLCRPVSTALAAYNEELDRTETFIEEMREEMDEYYDGKSATWQAAETGNAYTTWRDSIAFVDVSAVEADEPVAMDVPEMTTADELEALNDSPDEA